MPVVLNAARLLYDFQQVNRIGQSISGCFDPGIIAHRITDGLVETFDSAFARIWLTHPDQRSLSLVASSGLYTHLNGSFAQVPMGAYKVGKIAQNRVPFLSNCLPDEAWVKDRDWAIANRLQGFAGYPLVAGDGLRSTDGQRVLGVLVTFSHAPMEPEFLEVLQLLCLTATIALDAAMQFPPAPVALVTPLSDYLAGALSATRLMLVGTERELPPTIAHVLLRSVEVLQQLDCRYCRLTYGSEQVALEALVMDGDRRQFEPVQVLAEWLGGTCHSQLEPENRLLELRLTIPYQTQFPGIPTPPMPVGDDLALSDRERKIMVLLAQGLRDRAISQALHISESTVKFHIHNCLSKLQAKNRYQAIYEAAKRDWI
jgi:DNA-binding CsgD family transcriptional regulator